jgi:hypothetical protein
MYTVRSLTLPSTNLEVLGSTPIEPEQYTMPLYLTAWDSCGIGLGALSVSTAVWRSILLSESKHSKSCG